MSVLASLEDGWAAGAPFRLVLARDKLDRLAERAAGLQTFRTCNHAGCDADGLPVLLIDSEQEAVLCPVHQLVLADGSRVSGEPMLAAPNWWR